MEDKSKCKLWDERIEQFKASGLTQSEWCRQQDLKPHQLGYCLRKQRAEEDTLNPH